ncbi:unnamed protein product [Prunus armeniaca]
MKAGMGAKSLTRMGMRVTYPPSIRPIAIPTVRQPRPINDDIGGLEGVQVMPPHKALKFFHILCEDSHLSFIHDPQNLKTVPDVTVLAVKKYVQEILDRFEMKDCNSVCTRTEIGLKLEKNSGEKKVDQTLYKHIVGSLMYLTATRPDIQHVVSLISRYMECPEVPHLAIAKRIFLYLKGTINFGILYKKGAKSGLFGFTDSDYAGDPDDRRSTSGYAFIMGAGAILWSSKKQQIVTLSTTEVEFIAAAACDCQAIWLRRIVKELRGLQEGPTPVYYDNNSAIKLSKNPVLHGRSKHIDVRFHFLRNLTKDETIDLIYCISEDQVADILTKPLKLPAFSKLRKLLGVCSVKDIA